MEFNPRANNEKNFRSKFLRVRSNFYMTPPNITDISHIDLAKQDGIYEEIMKLKEEDPVQVDGGYVNVEYTVTVNNIDFTGTSNGFEIPAEGVVYATRVTTQREAQEQNPDFEIGI